MKEDLSDIKVEATRYEDEVEDEVLKIEKLKTVTLKKKCRVMHACSPCSPCRVHAVLCRLESCEL